MTFMVPAWSQTVVDFVVASEQHTLLEAAVLEADLADTLSEAGPFTLFAPTDDAINSLAASLQTDAAGILALPNLVDILEYHVVEGLVLSTDLAEGAMETTLFGADVTFSLTGGAMVNDANIGPADNVADNGVVHVIDAVLLTFGCTDETACNYDALALADDGSCELPGDMCDDGDEGTVNDMIGEDCGCAGIPATVVDIVVNSPAHELLEAAVGAAGLVDDLATAEAVTLFAPTDDAITALVTAMAISAEELLALPELAGILTYHAVGAVAMSTDLSDGQQFTTLQGSDVSVTITDDAVMINQAMVTVADLVAGNGVVHVIDAVLLPEGCTNPDACNYDPFALFDDEFCGENVGATCDDMLWYTENDAVEAGCGCSGTAIAFTSIADILTASPDHGVLVQAADSAGLVPTLASDTVDLTVFAPTDAAIGALVAELGITAEALLTSEDLANILLYHVVGGSVMSGDLMDGQEVETLFGADISISISGDTVMINQAMVTVADLVAANGVVHVIDAVLFTEGCTDENACNYDPLALVNDGSCGEAIGTTCDDMLWYTENDSVEAGCSCAGTAIAFASIAEILTTSPDHGLLVQAADTAGLVPTLASDTVELTVFAPTDDAIGALVAAMEITAEELLALPNLGDILLYHVVGGVALSTDLSDGQEIPTLQGDNVNVTIAAGTVKVNDATVILADLIADNGVVHVIDAVLMPPTPDSIDEAVANWTVIPNPAKDIITLTGVAPAARIAMIDLTGRTVREFAQGTNVLSVGDMPRGTYLLTVTEGRNIRTKKVMVQ